ncbi:hypothetical protein C6P40_004954 [Pichia californica]|uniref:C2H2-type domain-containing protein n=1 Tax=Pichia californica TaxID=460514 RepID=A0A9P7BGQ0_9ASCO|nr:hypothetical protein C6P42_000566 [[Candida] californica]KAG0689495.1 hypothetical protein C6P40_004954 [[Candida] californica]
MRNKLLKSRRKDCFLPIAKHNPKANSKLSTHEEYKSIPHALIITSSPCNSAPYSGSSQSHNLTKTVDPYCISNNNYNNDGNNNNIQSILSTSTENIDPIISKEDFLPNNSNADNYLDMSIDKSSINSNIFYLNTQKYLEDTYDPNLLADSINYHQYLYSNQSLLLNLDDNENDNNNNHDNHNNNKVVDSMYTNGIQNETFNSTSYELDSNLTPNTHHATNDDNINPIFYHETPSPSNTHSIRIVTASNRIVRLRDKKLLNAIHKTLDSPIKVKNNQQLHPQDILKNLNSNQQISRRILSSPRKDINDSLIKAISDINDNSSCIPKEFINNEFSKDIEIDDNKNEKDIYNLSKEIDTLPSQNSIILNNNNNNNNNNINYNNNNKNRKNKAFPFHSENLSQETNPKRFANKSISTNSHQSQFFIKLKTASTTASTTTSSLSTPAISSTTTVKFKTNKINKQQKQQKDQNSKLRSQTRKDENSTQTSQSTGSLDFQTELSHSNNSENIEESRKIHQNPDLVMQIFREPIKETTDHLSKSKSKENVSKISRVRVKIPRIHPASLDNFEEKDIYECVQCSKVFKQRSQWKRHVDCIHLKIAKFICVKCTKAFKRSDHLKNHVRRIHGGS